MHSWLEISSHRYIIAQVRPKRNKIFILLRLVVVNMFDLSKLTVYVRIGIPVSAWIQVMHYSMRYRIHPRLVWLLLFESGFSILISEKENSSGAAEA